MSCLPREAELALDGELDRQAVAVPAGLARDVAALHGLEAREDVLEDPRLDVVGAGHAVGGRRALVEHPGVAVAGLLDRRGRRRPARARRRAPRAPSAAGRPGGAPGGTSVLRGGCPVRRSAARSRRRDEAPGRPVPRGTTLLGPARPGETSRGPALLRAVRPVLPVGRGAASRFFRRLGVIFAPRTPLGSHRPRVARGCVRDYSSRRRPLGPRESSRARQRPSGMRGAVGSVECGRLAGAGPGGSTAIADSDGTAWCVAPEGCGPMVP